MPRGSPNRPRWSVQGNRLAFGGHVRRVGWVSFAAAAGDARPHARDIWSGPAAAESSAALANAAPPAAPRLSVPSAMKSTRRPEHPEACDGGVRDAEIQGVYSREFGLDALEMTVTMRKPADPVGHFASGYASSIEYGARAVAGNGRSPSANSHGRMSASSCRKNRGVWQGLRLEQRWEPDSHLLWCSWDVSLRLNRHPACNARPRWSGSQQSSARRASAPSRWPASWPSRPGRR